MKKIPIKTNNRKFYRQFLELIKSLPPINKLRPKEMDVLAEIMYENGKLKNIEDDYRYTLIFSTKNRREMRNLIGISEDSYNNNLSILRKHGLITKDNKLNKFLSTVMFQDNFSLEFLFKEVK
jgi:DNA-binding MarR family transcriptional regulator